MGSRVCSRAIVVLISLLLVAPGRPVLAASQAGGTWVLQQVSQPSDLQTSAVSDGLTTPYIRGLSERVPWINADQDTTLFDDGLALAQSYGVDFTARFMAGQWTPTEVFTAGSPYYTVPTNGKKVPTPFFADGSPNTIFEGYYRSEVELLANWCRAHSVQLLHLSWYGFRYAELYFGSLVKQQPGYSYQRWLTAHERLIDIAATYAGNGLSIEFPLSGGGNLVRPASDLGNYIANKEAAGIPIYIQANALATHSWGVGDWSKQQSVESAMDAAVWPLPIPRGEQMVARGDFDWDQIYANLNTNHASYVEIYSESYNSALAHHDRLLANIQAFAGNTASLSGKRRDLAEQLLVMRK